MKVFHINFTILLIMTIVIWLLTAFKVKLEDKLRKLHLIKPKATVKKGRWFLTYFDSLLLSFCPLDFRNSSGPFLNGFAILVYSLFSTLKIARHYSERFV